MDSFDIILLWKRFGREDIIVCTVVAQLRSVPVSVVAEFAEAAERMNLMLIGRTLSHHQTPVRSFGELCQFVDRKFLGVRLPIYNFFRLIETPSFPSNIFFPRNKSLHGLLGFTSPFFLHWTRTII